MIKKNCEVKKKFNSIQREIRREQQKFVSFCELKIL